MYWYFWVIVVALEAVAGARILGNWWPNVAPWEFTLALMTLFTIVNLLSVRSYGEAEFWFASIKVAAIMVFLGAGVLFALGLWPGAHAGLPHLTSHGGFMPKGIIPVLTGAVAATGFYFGAEIVTIAAAESAEPERAIAETTQSVIWRVLVFYIGSIFLVVALVPWNDTLRMAQPYVSVMEVLRIPAAGTLMSLVILTAVLSALNSGLFASSRMLMALAGRGDAPHAMARLDQRGVPVAAILASTAFGYVTVVMSYLSPDRIFAFLVSSYGTVAIFVYVLIAVAELTLRARLERESPDRLRVRMWGYPYLTLIAILAMVCIVAAMGFIPSLRYSLLFGLASAAAMVVGYAARNLARSGTLSIARSTDGPR
jgi:GABA permease